MEFAFCLDLVCNPASPFASLTSPFPIFLLADRRSPTASRPNLLVVPRAFGRQTAWVRRSGVHPRLLLTASVSLSPRLACRQRLTALAPEEKLTFEKAGPTGQATFEAGVAGFETRATAAAGWSSEPFEVSDGARPPPSSTNPNPHIGRVVLFPCD